MILRLQRPFQETINANKYHIQLCFRCNRDNEISFGGGIFLLSIPRRELLVTHLKSSLSLGAIGHIKGYISTVKRTYTRTKNENKRYRVSEGFSAISSQRESDDSTYRAG